MRENLRHYSANGTFDLNALADRVPDVPPALLECEEVLWPRKIEICSLVKRPSTICNMRAII